MNVRTPVSVQTLRWAIVTSMKLSRATALPLEAIAVRLNPRASTRPLARRDQQPGRCPAEVVRR